MRNRRWWTSRQATKLNLQTWWGPVENEWGRPWLQQEKQAVRNYPKNWSHLQESVFLFRKLAVPLVNRFVVSVLGAILCETDQIIFQKVLVHLILKEISSFLFVIAYRSAWQPWSVSFCIRREWLYAPFWHIRKASVRIGSHSLRLLV